MYKSMRDAIRYRQKKTVGKSGDSGGEDLNDDATQDDWTLKDALSFLTPTSSRFARKTMVMGGGELTKASTSTFDPAQEDEDHDRLQKKLLFEIDDDNSEQSSVYSFVSNFHIPIFHFEFNLSIEFCVCVYACVIQ